MLPGNYLTPNIIVLLFNRCAYQLHHLLGTDYNQCFQPIVLLINLYSYVLKLLFIGFNTITNTQVNFSCPLDHQTSIFICSKARQGKARQSDLHVFFPTLYIIISLVVNFKSTYYGECF